MGISNARTCLARFSELFIMPPTMEYDEHNGIYGLRNLKYTPDVKITTSPFAEQSYHSQFTVQRNLSGKFVCAVSKECRHLEFDRLCDWRYLLIVSPDDI